MVLTPSELLSCGGRGVVVVVFSVVVVDGMLKFVGGKPNVIRPPTNLAHRITRSDTKVPVCVS
jgi:hypothetical protein